MVSTPLVFVFVDGCKVFFNPVWGQPHAGDVKMAAVCCNSPSEVREELRAAAVTLRHGAAVDYRTACFRSKRLFVDGSMEEALLLSRISRTYASKSGTSVFLVVQLAVAALPARLHTHTPTHSLATPVLVACICSQIESFNSTCVTHVNAFHAHKSAINSTVPQIRVRHK